MRHITFRALAAGFGIIALALFAGCSQGEQTLKTPVSFEGGVFGSFYQVSVSAPLTKS
jgi:thiamine biosynthesis lipoprotein